MHFLETRTFWEWLLITVILIPLILLGRAEFRKHLQRNTPPDAASLLILATVLLVLNLRAAPTGDEPHYLVMTQSFLQDGDFDLRNNYEQMDYMAYYPTTIPDPHVTIVGDHWYPVHGIGLPLLMVPFFALGGRVGVVIMLVLMTITGIRFLGSLLQSAGFGPKATGYGSLVSCLTLPLIVLSGQIFPEVPAFLLVVLGLQALVAPTLTRWKFAGFLLSLGFLPWLHPKYTILALMLLLSMVLTHHRNAVRNMVIASGLLIVSIAGLIFLTYQWYGVPLPGVAIMMPKAPFGENWLIPLLGNFFVRPWIGLTGALFDQQSGLFLASPIFILAIPGWIYLWQQKRIISVSCAMIFASVYLPVGVFGVWYGGFSSPARLLTPAIPVLALSIASLLELEGQRVWKFFSILAIPSFIHAYLMMTLPSFTRYGDVLSQHNYFIGVFEKLIHLDLTPLFPTFRNLTPMTWITTSIYVIVILVITFLLMPHKAVEHVNNAQPSSEAIL